MSEGFEATLGFQRLKAAMREVVNLPKAEVARIKSKIKPPRKRSRGTPK